MLTSDGSGGTSVTFRRSVGKMAAQKSVSSDLYKCVYSFLLENKFTKAAQQFMKQTKVVSDCFCLVDRQVDVQFVSRCVEEDALHEE